LPLGRCAAGRAGAADSGTAGLSACVVGGESEVATVGGGGGGGGAASVVMGRCGGAAAGRGAAAEATGAGVPVAAARGAGDAASLLTGGCSSLFPQAMATGASRRTVTARRALDVMAAPHRGIPPIAARNRNNLQKEVPDAEGRRSPVYRRRLQ